MEDPALPPPAGLVGGGWSCLAWCVVDPVAGAALAEETLRPPPAREQPADGPASAREPREGDRLVEGSAPVEGSRPRVLYPRREEELEGWWKGLPCSSSERRPTEICEGTSGMSGDWFILVRRREALENEAQLVLGTRPNPGPKSFPTKNSRAVMKNFLPLFGRSYLPTHVVKFLLHNCSVSSHLSCPQFVPGQSSTCPTTTPHSLLHSSSTILIPRANNLPRTTIYTRGPATEPRPARRSS